MTDKTKITVGEMSANKAILTPNDAIKEEHYLILDQWFSNGYNGAGAVRSIRPELTTGSAKVLFNTLSKLDHCKTYIGNKRQELRASVNIEPEQVTRELITWLYSDATDYIDMTPDQVKALPMEAKRCIQSIKHRKKEYTTKLGDNVMEESMEIRIIDKTKAVEILNKMLGNYALDNKQKATNVNIEQLNVQELKVLANILNKAKD